MNDPVLPPHLPKMIQTEGGLAPEAPANIQATGLEGTILLDLALRTAHVLPQFTTESMARRLLLPVALTNTLLDQLRADHLLETLGQEGAGYRYSIAQRGRERAERLMEISGYIGPAPVPLEAYRAMLEWQEAQSTATTPEQVQQALASLVLPQEALQVAGLAIASGRSLFLSGPPGNGKTSVGRALHDVMHGDIWIPHSIAVENNVIRLFDAHCHSVSEHPVGKNQLIDRRWVKIHRPFIVAGGEMTLESLDMAYLSAQHYYEAPLHMKANGGMFLIDDFGRQHVNPSDLLNRWIIPLEHRIDFLTLHGGQKIQVPFLLMLIIATNLAPEDVTDPAFMRRMGYRLRLDAPLPERYADIFTRYAAERNIAGAPELVQLLLERYRAEKRELRACEPRDLIERACDICRYRSQPLALNEEVLDMAWKGYFGNDTIAA